MPLAGAAATLNLGTLVPERGVRERLERVVQGRQFADDGRVALACVESAIERPQLVAEAVEPLEQGVQLAITELLPFHRTKF